MIRQLVILSALVCAGLPAQICFSGFASLSPSDRSSLIETTFLALLDLPAGEARQRLLKIVDEAGDPFAIPQHDAAFAVAYDKLKEFRNMLEGLGWNTPQTHARLLALVRDHIAALDRSQAKLDQAVRRLRPQSFTFRAWADSAVFSPDGRYVVGTKRLSDPPTLALSLADIAQDKVHEGIRVPAPSHLNSYQDWAPRWNGDGTKIAFLDRFRLAVHDVKDGDVAPEPYYVGARSVWGRLFRKFSPVIRDAVPTSDPNRMLVQIEGKSGVYLFDLAEKKASKVKGSDAIHSYAQFNTLYADWAYAPSNETLVALGTNGKTRAIELKTATLSPDGTAGPWKTVKQWPPPASPMELSDKRNNLEANADYVVLRDTPQSGDLRAIVLKDGSEIDLTKLIPSLQLGTVTRLDLHPNGEELGIFSYTEKTGPKLHWVNLDTRQYEGAVDINSGNAALAPDGDRYFGRHWNGVSVTPFSLQKP